MTYKGFYDPEIGRFLQEDPFRGNPRDALSLNRYTYAHNSPMVYWDPTGYSAAKITTPPANAGTPNVPSVWISGYGWMSTKNVTNMPAGTPVTVPGVGGTLPSTGSSGGSSNTPSPSTPSRNNSSGSGNSNNTTAPAAPTVTLLDGTKVTGAVQGNNINLFSPSNMSLHFLVTGATMDHTVNLGIRSTATLKNSDTIVNMASGSTLIKTAGSRAVIGTSSRHVATSSDGSGLTVVTTSSNAAHATLLARNALEAATGSRNGMVNHISGDGGIFLTVSNPTRDITPEIRAAVQQGHPVTWIWDNVITQDSSQRANALGEYGQGADALQQLLIAVLLGANAPFKLYDATMGSIEYSLQTGLLVNGQPVSQFDLDLAHASGHVLAGYGFATVVGGYHQALRPGLAGRNIVGTNHNAIRPTQDVVNPQRVSDYARRLQAGERLPAIEVVEVPGRGRYIIEGHHRYVASQQTGIPIEIRTVQGTGPTGMPDWSSVQWRTYISESQFWNK